MFHCFVISVFHFSDAKEMKQNKFMTTCINKLLLIESMIEEI